MYRNWHICTLQHNTTQWRRRVSFKSSSHPLDFRFSQCISHINIICVCACACVVHTICTHGARIDACYKSDNKMNHPDNPAILTTQQHAEYGRSTHINENCWIEALWSLLKPTILLKLLIKSSSANAIAHHAFSIRTHLLLVAQYANK